MRKYIAKFMTIMLITLMMIISSPFLVTSQPTQPILENQTERQSYPVTLNGQELFTITENFGDIKAEERAKNVSKAIKNLATNTSISINSIESLNQDGITFVYTNKLSSENIIFSLTEADAKATNSSQEELTQQYLNRLKESLRQYRQERKETNILRGILATLICTLALTILLLVSNFIFGKLESNFTSNYHSLKGITIKGIDLISGARLTKNLLGLIKNLRWLINFAIIAIYITLVLSFFPWTKRIGLKVWNYLINAIQLIWEQFLDYIPNFFIAAVIAFITYYIIRLIKPIFQEIETGSITIPGFYQEWAEPTYRLIELLIIALAAIMIFPYLPGFGSPAFQNVSILVGVLVSLGSSTVMSNIVSGIILIYTRAFQIGDRVKINDTLGDIEEKSLLVTRIRTFENILITIPNSSLLSSNIVNFSASIRDTRTPVMLTAVVTLGYDVPWQKIYETLIQAALSTSYILEYPLPLVLQTSLGDFSVTYELKAYTNYPTKMELIYSELYQNMQDKCNEVGIEILSPTYSAIRDGNTSTIPENYLSQDYIPDGFQLNPLGNLFQIDLNLTPNKNQKNNSKND